MLIMCMDKPNETDLILQYMYFTTHEFKALSAFFYKKMDTALNSLLCIENIDKYKFPTPKDFVNFFGRFGAICSIFIEPQTERARLPKAPPVHGSLNHEFLLNAELLSTLNNQSARKEKSFTQVYKGKINYFLEDDAQKAANALNNHLHGKYHLKIFLDKSPKQVFPGFIPAWQRSADFHKQATEVILKSSMNVQKEVLEKVQSAMRVGASLEPLIAYVPSMYDIPNDIRYLIDTTAQYVAQHGQLFEKIIFLREKNNMVFGLFISSPWVDDLISIYDMETLEFRQKCRLYYQWRVYSFMNGDSRTLWKSDPYQPFEGGTVFFPPDCETNQSFVARKPESGAILSSEEQRALIMLLRHVIQERESIGQVSHFILRNYAASDQISNLLCHSITHGKASDGSLLARMYVLNDVLHNANKWNAEACSEIRNFIGSLTPHIGLICATMREQFLSIGAVERKKIMIEKMNAVLRSWKKDKIFSEAFIDSL